jgi:hypothetical protein
MSLDLIFSILGLILDIALLTVLVRNKIYRDFPVFTLFMAESTLSVVIMLPIYKYLSTGFYFNAYMVDFSVSSLLQVALLVELMWSALKPIRTSLPRHSLLILVLLIIPVCAILWPIVGMTDPTYVTFMGKLLFRSWKLIALLRIAIFLLIATFSRLLATGWKNRELQISTGLGFYSLIFLAVTLIHTYRPVDDFYHFYDQFLVFCYLLTLIYWLLSFLKDEPERKIITPQMERTLLLLGGAVKSYRVAVTDSIVTKQDEPREP